MGGKQKYGTQPKISAPLWLRCIWPALAYGAWNQHHTNSVLARGIADTITGLTGVAIEAVRL